MLNKEHISILGCKNRFSVNNNIIYGSLPKTNNGTVYLIDGLITPQYINYDNNRIDIDKNIKSKIDN